MVNEQEEFTDLMKFKGRTIGKVFNAVNSCLYLYRRLGGYLQYIKNMDVVDVKKYYDGKLDDEKLEEYEMAIEDDMRHFCYNYQMMW